MDSSTNTATNGRIERSFTFGPGVTPRVVAHNPTGTIEIRGEAREDVAVLVVVTPPDALEHGLEIRVAQAGDTVTAEVRWQPVSGLLHGWHARVSLDIRVPRQSVAAATTASGSVRVAGITGGVMVQCASGEARLSDIAGGVGITTASGGIRLSDVQGAVRCETASGGIRIEGGNGTYSLQGASGSVQVENLVGPFECRTASGSVTARACAFPRARVTTASGSIKLSTALDLHGAYAFETASGSVELRVPDRTAMTVSYRTMSGSVSSDLPTQRDGGKRNGTLIVNGGGVSVEMSSMSGSLSVRATNDSLPALSPTDHRAETMPALAVMEDAPAMQDAPAAPAESSETLRILQAVERGELSIDEAMARLDALEEAEG